MFILAFVRMPFIRPSHPWPVFIPVFAVAFVVNYMNASNHCYTTHHISARWNKHLAHLDTKPFLPGRWFFTYSPIPAHQHP